MKQQSVNSFSEGLNFDLNPLTTPNNVLTDCVNGTFITFNGDELSLQNDSGNTKISVPLIGATEYDIEKTDYEIGDEVYTIQNGLDLYYTNLTGSNLDGLNATDWEESCVKLSPGFYPIGIKEYGGVLYIVSAKKPDDAELWVAGTYSQDEYVKDSLGFYYRSLQDDNSEILPVVTNDYWEVIGDIYAYNNREGLIEFGSYPSPQFADNTDTYTEITGELSSLLYKQITISEEIFKSGRSIIFETMSGGNGISNSFDTDHISYYNGDTYVPVFYKVKLWHKLSNGFYDLTDDIWLLYKGFLNPTLRSSSTFWFNDQTFTYFCPYQYKGLLAYSIEVENLDYFELDGEPNLAYSYTSDGDLDGYLFTIPVKAYSSVEELKVRTVHFEVELNGVSIYSDDINTELDLTTGIYRAIASVPVDLEEMGGQLSYTVSPIIESYIDTVYEDITNDLPSNYLNQYIFTGTRLIVIGYGEITFVEDTNTVNYTCDYENKWAYITRFILRNTDGDLVDSNGQLSTIPYVLLEENTDVYTQQIVNDSSSSLTEVILAVYSFNEWSNYPTIVYKNQNLDANEAIYTSFEQIQVAKLDDRCSLVDITILLSNDITLENATLAQQVVVTQVPYGGDLLEVTLVDSKTITFQADSDFGYDVYINPAIAEHTWVSSYFIGGIEDPDGLFRPYYPITESYSAPTEETTHNYGLILRVHADVGQLYSEGATSSTDSDMQLVSFMLGIFFDYSSESLPSITSPTFRFYYGGSSYLANMWGQSNEFDWLPTEEVDSDFTWLDYRYYLPTSTTGVLSNGYGTTCFEINGGNTLLSDSSFNSIICDNISTRSDYSVITVGTNNYIMKNTYQVGTITPEGSTEYYDNYSNYDDIGYISSPMIVKYRSSDLSEVTISGSSSVSVGNTIVLTANNAAGHVTWIYNLSYFLETTRTQNTITLQALQASPPNQLIWVVDTYGNNDVNNSSPFIVTIS